MRPPVKPRTRREAAAAIEALQASCLQDEDHEREIRATDAGRTAAMYRQEAHELSDRGDYRAATLYCLQAVAVLNRDPDGVGMAAARHDLANALTNDPAGHSTKWIAARELLEEVVTSSARLRFPRRWALSASLLATCLRRLAAHEDDSRRAQKFERAEGLLARAIDAAEGACSWLDAAGYWMNLGNLRSARNDLAGAIEACERGYECAQVIAAHAGHVMTRLLVNLGTLLLERNRAGDKGRGRAMLQRAVRATDAFATLARLTLAGLAAKERKHELARSYLDCVDLSMFPIESLDEAMQLYEQLGRADDGTRRLQDFIEQQLHERAQTIADLPADRVEARIQRCALVLAEALLRQRRTIDAFLVLENTSALRFSEATATHGIVSADPLVRDLQRDRERHGTTAALLEDILDRLASTSTDQWHDALLEQRRACEAVGPTASLSFAEVAETLRAATVDSGIELTALVRARDLAAREATRAAIDLAARAPASGLTGGPLDSDVDQAELKSLLALAPGSVFIRLTLGSQGDLLALSTYLQDDEVVATASKARCPADLFERLQEFAKNPGRPAAAAHLTDLFRSLDLSPALGGLTHRTALLMPSSLVARLPIVALGPPGARLLDLVRSIIWLPNLFALRRRQPGDLRRVGTYLFAPGERGRTKWHSVALARALPDERRFLDESASLAAVLELAPVARVASFYAHGRYIDGEQSATQDRDPGPSIALAEPDKLALAALTDQWIGIERVELWGCQTGVNLPMDPMGVLVDEAFGFDYEFLRVGALSAIGSLYTVPEVMTAALVIRFRQHILDGATAPVALAEAQRAWLDRDLPRLVALLRSHPTDGLAQFATELGGTLSTGATRGGDAGAYEAILSCPAIWASFRYVGWLRS